MCLPLSLCLFLGMLLTANETPKMGIYYIPVSDTERSYDKNRTRKDTVFFKLAVSRDFGSACGCVN